MKTEIISANIFIAASFIAHDTIAELLLLIIGMIWLILAVLFRNEKRINKLL